MQRVSETRTGGYVMSAHSRQGQWCDSHVRRTNGTSMSATVYDGEHTAGTASLDVDMHVAISR